MADNEIANMLQNVKPLRGTKPKLLVVTPDEEFARQIREGMGSGSQLELSVHDGGIEAVEAELSLKEIAILVVDLDEGGDERLRALQRVLMRFPASFCTVVTRKLDEALARWLLQVKVADFLIKPVTAGELSNVCLRALHGSPTTQGKEANIVSLLPAMGGVGCTTLAIETALLLQRESRNERASTCLVDLNFQHGSCAEYLDLEPRLDVSEIEPRPERLDRQLLEVMLSRHRSGLSVIAAPGKPAETVHVDPETVSRLLDLVAANFEHVVIDLPRNWFPWTDSVLLGSNRLFVVGEMTVPALRHARNLAKAIGERLGDAPSPGIIVNRFEQRTFGHGIRRGDIEQVLGSAFAGTVTNHYRLVREAIDQGVPLFEMKAKNGVSADLRKVIFPAQHAGGSRRSSIFSLGVKRSTTEREDEAIHELAADGLPAAAK